MTPDFLLLYILLIHFLGDFALQTDYQAKNKASDPVELTYHAGVYSLVWFVAVLPILGWASIEFAIITMCFHWLTDAVSSNIGKKFWAKGDMHNGFVIVGFDQLLHYVQLYLTLKYLM